MKSSLVRSLACACFLLASGSVQSQSDPDASTRTKLLALEDVWNNAGRAGDSKALNLLLDEAMVYVDEEGSILTKRQFLEQVKEQGKRVQTLTTEDVRATVIGDMAMVSGTYWVSGVDRGRAFRREGRFIDIRVLRNGAWLCVTAQSTPVRRVGAVDT